MPISLSFLSTVPIDSGLMVQAIGFGAAALYHQIASYRDRQVNLPPGQIFTLGDGTRRHLQVKGTGDVTIVLDASLGGVEGYLLIEELAKLTRVCIYDRAGYGWSDRSTKPRHSQQIVDELAELLAVAKIEPPYLLVGDSFGTYNLRLFAHQYPDRARGLVLTDGLHEGGMLSLAPSVGLLKAFFTLSFGFVAMAAAVGVVRICGDVGIFELIKPELKQFPKSDRQRTKRSFYYARHWWTMGREMWNLDASGRQLKVADNLGELPIVSIKSQTFLRPIFGIPWLSLPAADRTRDRIHLDLAKLSTNFRQISATNSSHFVWIDEPEVIAEAIRCQKIGQINQNRPD